MRFLEKVESLLPTLEEAEKSLTSDIAIDNLRASQSALLHRLGGMNPELIQQGMKEYSSLMSKFRKELVGVVKGVQTGELTRAQAFAKWKTVTGQYYTDLFRAGAKSTGNIFYSKMGLTRQDAAFISGARREESKYFKGFLDDIEKGGGKLDYETRAGFYGDSGSSQFFNGQIAGYGNDIIIRWVMDMFAEHCADCPTLSLQTYTWKTLPFVPRSGNTACMSGCKCHLEFEPAQESMGLPILPGKGTLKALTAPGKYAEVYGPDGNKIKGELEKQLDDLYAQMYKARQMITAAPDLATKQEWIQIRKRLNAAVIQAKGNYRVIPTISVKQLVTTVKSAIEIGGVITPLENLIIGDEVLFVRGDFSAYGIVKLLRNRLMVSTATGMEIPVSNDTDIVFVLKKVGPTTEQLIAEGGAGSGNFGHGGRKGEVGGSSKGDGGEAGTEWSPKMDREKAEVWAKDSVVKEPVFHATGAKNVEPIKNEGFKVRDDPVWTGAYGKGVYISSDGSSSSWGSKILELRINVKNPIDFANVYDDTVEKWYASSGNPETEDIGTKYTAYAKHLGHDSILIRREGGVKWYVVFDPKHITVVGEK